jgi:hypothetical protein
MLRCPATTEPSRTQLCSLPAVAMRATPVRLLSPATRRADQAQQQTANAQQQGSTMSPTPIPTHLTPPIPPAPAGSLAVPGQFHPGGSGHSASPLESCCWRGRWHAWHGWPLPRRCSGRRPAPAPAAPTAAAAAPTAAARRVAPSTAVPPTAVPQAAVFRAAAAVAAAAVVAAARRVSQRAAVVSQAMGRAAGQRGRWCSRPGPATAAVPATACLVAAGTCRCARGQATAAAVLLHAVELAMMSCAVLPAPEPLLTPPPAAMARCNSSSTHNLRPLRPTTHATTCRHPCRSTWT